MTTTINMDLDFPGGSPAAHATVAIRLHAGTAGGSDGSTVIGDTINVQLSSTGTGSVDLVDNASITPANTYYSFTLLGARPQLVRYITVPAAGGPYDLGDAAIQASAPTPPELYPVPSAGSADQVLRTDGTVASWATIGVDDLSDVDTTTAAPTTGQALVWDGSEWAPGTVAGGGSSAAAATVVDYFLGVSAVDGTATVFDFMSYTAGTTASGNVPANYTSLSTVPDVATLQAGLGGDGTQTVTVFCPAHNGVYTFTPNTVTSAWTEVDTDTAVWMSGAAAYQFTVTGTANYPNEASSLPFTTGVGLTANIGTVGGALNSLEGALDSHRWVSAVATSDVDTTDFGNASFEYGGLRFVDGAASATTHCYVWLRGQTTSSENGVWKVDVTTYAGTQYFDPDVFDPPGNGAMRQVSYPGHRDHGMEWEWLDSDSTKWQLRSTATPASAIGTWVLRNNPAAEPVMVRLGTDQTVDDSNIPADTTGFACAVEAGVTYAITGQALMVGDISRDAYLGATFPAGTMKMTAAGVRHTSSSMPASINPLGVITSSGDYVSVGTFPSDVNVVELGGTYVCTTSGTLQIQHSQRNKAAATVLATVQAGSHLRLIPIV